MGKERDAALILMRKYFDALTSPSPMQILACFARDNLKGYIYIEARHKAHVQSAIENLPFIYSSSTQLVPLNDMASTLFVKPETTDIKIGGWVRVRKGRYKGDLVKVEEYLPERDLISVLIIPRLDLTPTAAPVAGEDKKDKKRKKFATRPAQKLFNPDEVKRFVYFCPFVPCLPLVLATHSLTLTSPYFKSFICPFSTINQLIHFTN